MKRGIKCK